MFLTTIETENSRSGACSPTSSHSASSEPLTPDNNMDILGLNSLNRLESPHPMDDPRLLDSKMDLLEPSFPYRSSLELESPLPPSPFETTFSTESVQLKVRYVAKDLWLTLTVPPSASIGQLKQMCLMKCQLIPLPNENDPNNNAVFKTTSNDSKDKERKRLSIHLSPTSNLQSGPMKRSNSQNNGSNLYGLYWRSAGHWLDEFRMIDSYKVPDLDILELQHRKEFIYLAPSTYHLHYAEGTLLKLRGGVKPGWRKRHFLVQDRCIWYFKKREDRDPIGNMDLSRSFQILETSIDVQGENVSCLVLKSKDKAWYLRALDEQDLDHWRRILVEMFKELDNSFGAGSVSDQSISEASVVTANLTVSPVTTSNTTSTGKKSTVTKTGMKIKAGFMFRKAPITNAFRSRYFVLRGKELSCHKSDRFDQNNPAKVISLHTCEIVAFQHHQRYYFQITDKQQAGDEEPANLDFKAGKKSKAKSEFASIISSTKSLPQKLSGWVSKSSGAQLSVEHIYVESREEYEQWKTAFEVISDTEVIEKDYRDLRAQAKPKSSSKSTMTSISTSLSFLSKFSRSSDSQGSKKSFKLNLFKSKTNQEGASGSKGKAASPKVDNDVDKNQPTSARFSTFLKTRSSKQEVKASPSPKNVVGTASKGHQRNRSGRYDDIDDRDGLSTKELQLSLEQMEMFDIEEQSHYNGHGSCSMTSGQSSHSIHNVPLDSAILEGPGPAKLDFILSERDRDSRLMWDQNSARSSGSNPNLRMEMGQDGRMGLNKESQHVAKLLAPKKKSFIWFKRS